MARPSQASAFARKIAWVEFGGNKSLAFEYVTTRNIDEIENGRMTVVGPDIDSVQPGSAMPLGIWVEVAGRKMQDRLRTDSRAPDPPLDQRWRGHLAHGTA